MITGTKREGQLSWRRILPDRVFGSADLVADRLDELLLKSLRVGLDPGLEDDEPAQHLDLWARSSARWCS